MKHRVKHSHVLVNDQRISSTVWTSTHGERRLSIAKTSAAPDICHSVHCSSDDDPYLDCRTTSSSTMSGNPHLRSSSTKSYPLLASSFTPSTNRVSATLVASSQRYGARIEITNFNNVGAIKVETHWISMPDVTEYKHNFSNVLVK